MILIEKQSIIRKFIYLFIYFMIALLLFSSSRFQYRGENIQRKVLSR